MPAYRLPTTSRQPNRYPLARVLLGFMFGGHLIGCCLLLLWTAVGNGIANPAAFLISLMLMWFFGWPIGTVPALLCGILIAVFRLHKTPAGVAAATFIGALSGLLTACLLMLYNGKPFFFDSPAGWVVLSAATACLLAVWLLPRSKCGHTPL